MKHWTLIHPDMKEAPDIRFRVVRNHRDGLSRLLNEAVLIEKCGTINSKSEWSLNEKTRLVIEKSGWEMKKTLEKE